jgi:starch synthase
VLRFALLGWVGSEMASGLDPFWRPDVVHAHDWHAGLTPAYLAARGRPAKSVFTVHNLAYQGMFYSWHMNDIELPWSFYNMHGLEFNGQISFLKAGLYYADHITAVSPTYAREITEPQFAYGMEGLLRQRHHEGRLSGILNGVDDGIWSPETDLLLAMRYDRDSLEDKAENKRQLQIAMGLKVDDKAPLFAVVSRLTSQKGLDLVLEALPGLLSRAAAGAAGRGRSGAAGRFPRRRRRTSGQSGVQIGYHEAFSTALWAAPTSFWCRAFEPCGLTQLYGLKYGTLPLVRRTGGLADTVPTVRWKTWPMVSPQGLSLRTAMPGRCCARFGALSSCGPVALALRSASGDEYGF